MFIFLILYGSKITIKAYPYHANIANRDIHSSMA